MHFNASSEVRVESSNVQGLMERLNNPLDIVSRTLSGDNKEQS